MNYRGYLLLGTMMMGTVAIAPFKVVASPAASAISASESILTSFGGSVPGSEPFTGLVRGQDGMLYGTTSFGGQLYGTLFRVSADGTVFPLYEFKDKYDGAYPGQLMVAADGSLYGMTGGGGRYGHGTIFKYTTSGKVVTVHQFRNGAVSGTAALVQDNAGNLYGTTLFGGSKCASPGCGTIFSLSPQGKYSVLYSFTGKSDGEQPMTGLTLGPDGNLYGTTPQYPSKNLGTLFRITMAGTFTTIHSFNMEDGDSPSSPLLLASDGNFYGTTSVGGTGACSDSLSSGCGTVFRLKMDGTLTTIHEFQGGATGALPLGALTQGADGNLYGTTVHGGPGCTADLQCGSGTAYQLALNGSFTSLYSFAGGTFGVPSSDGSAPNGSLLETSPGTFLGTTPNGGAVGVGTIYQIVIQ